MAYLCCTPPCMYTPSNVPFFSLPQNFPPPAKKKMKILKTQKTTEDTDPEWEATDKNSHLVW